MAHTNQQVTVFASLYVSSNAESLTMDLYGLNTYIQITARTVRKPILDQVEYCQPSKDLVVSTLQKNISVSAQKKTIVSTKKQSKMVTVTA